MFPPFTLGPIRGLHTSLTSPFSRLNASSQLLRNKMAMEPMAMEAARQLAMPDSVAEKLLRSRLVLIAGKAALAVLVEETPGKVSFFELFIFECGFGTL